jgi:hypothetical protein
MIIIHFDYTDGTELSYQEGIEKGSNFTTCCLDFFSFDTLDNVIVLQKDGSYIDRDELLTNHNKYSSKEIRTSHNIQKLLKANAFKFIK